MGRYKYNVGDRLGPYNVLFLEEAGVEKGHRKGIFKCPICGEPFKGEPSRIAKGDQKTCFKCSYLSRTKYKEGSFVGKDNNILLLERNVNNNPLLVRLKCPTCEREDWIVDLSSIYKTKQCYDCYKKERIKNFSEKKVYKENDLVGPNKIKFLGYSETGYRIHSKGFFECLSCGNVFNARIEHVANGKISYCNKCMKSTSSGEKFIKDYLESKKCLFESQKSFNNCINLKTNAKLRFDFYLPEYNTCIEYDGEQHFNKIDFFGGEEGLKSLKERDQIKNLFCKENNIKLIRFNYLSSYSSILEVLDDLIKEGD